MYAPQYPVKPQASGTAIPHVHPLDKTLRDHEDDEQFKTYLAGRTLAYSRAISDVHIGIARAQELLDKNPHDSALRALIEGQLEGAQEILTLLQKAKDKDQP